MLTVNLWKSKVLSQHSFSRTKGINEISVGTFDLSNTNTYLSLFISDTCHFCLHYRIQNKLGPCTFYVTDYNSEEDARRLNARLNIKNVAPSNSHLLSVTTVLSQKPNVCSSVTDSVLSQAI
jgi:hypothetical protein